MPINLMKSELQYCSPFLNASTANEGMLPKSRYQNCRLCIKNWLPWQRRLRDRNVIYQAIKLFYVLTNPEILMKVSPLDSDIPGLESQSFKRN